MSLLVTFHISEVAYLSILSTSCQITPEIYNAIYNKTQETKRCNLRNAIGYCVIKSSN